LKDGRFHLLRICNPQSAFRYMSASVEQDIQYRMPEAGSLRRPLLVWSITAALVLLYVSLIAIAPLALSSGHDTSAFVLYQMFSRLCHQIPERAFFLEGYPLAVCARCTGIYLGFAAGVLIYPLVRSLKRGDTPPRRWLLLAAVPTLSDFALGFFGVVANTHWSRSLTGALLGAVAAFYVVPGLMDLSRMTGGRAFPSISR
jgi:uncharacterized membrane protein